MLQAKLESTDGVKGPTAGTVVDSETEKRRGIYRIDYEDVVLRWELWLTKGRCAWIWIGVFGF